MVVKLIGQKIPSIESYDQKRRGKEKNVKKNAKVKKDDDRKWENGCLKCHRK